MWGVRVGWAALVLLVVILGASLTTVAAQDQASLTFWLDPARPEITATTLVDQSGQGNNAALREGAAIVDNPPVLRFDGVDDLAVATTQLTAPPELTLSIRFRTTTPGGKLAGFENVPQGR